MSSFFFGIGIFIATLYGAWRFFVLLVKIAIRQIYLEDRKRRALEAQRGEA